MNAKQWVFTVLFCSATYAAEPAVPVLNAPLQDAVNIPARTLLIWNAAVGAATYHIQLATDSLFNDMILNDSTLRTASRMIGPLPVDTKYYWRVRAKNASGVGAFSATWSFTTGTKKFFGLFDQ